MSLFRISIYSAVQLALDDFMDVFQYLQNPFASWQPSGHMTNVPRLLPVTPWQHCSMLLRQSSRWKRRCHTDGLYLRDEALKGEASNTSSYQNQVSGMPIRFLAYLRLKPVYKRAAVSCSEPQHWQKKSQHLKIIVLIRYEWQDPDTTQLKMHLSASCFCGLLLFFNLQRFSAQPIRTGLTGPTGLTGTDINILKVSPQKDFFS